MDMYSEFHQVNLVHSIVSCLVIGDNILGTIKLDAYITMHENYTSPFPIFELCYSEYQYGHSIDFRSTQ